MPAWNFDNSAKLLMAVGQNSHVMAAWNTSTIDCPVYIGVQTDKASVSGTILRSGAAWSAKLTYGNVGPTGLVITQGKNKITLTPVTARLKQARQKKP